MVKNDHIQVKKPYEKQNHRNSKIQTKYWAHIHIHIQIQIQIQTSKFELFKP